MLEDPPPITFGRFARPAKAKLRQFEGVPLGHIVDAMDGRGALGHRIKPLFQDRARFVGTAVTCRCGPDDNLACFAALSLARPGDVIVADTDGYEDSAVTGDLLLGMAKNNGVVAFVTDGMVRDSDGIRAVGLPVFSAGVTPNSPVRNGPGTAGLPVTLGRVPVASGDVLVGDRDGVVVVPRARLDAVLKRLPQIAEAEAAMEKRVAAGLKLPAWAENALKGGGS